MGWGRMGCSRSGMGCSKALRQEPPPRPWKQRASAELQMSTALRRVTLPERFRFQLTWLARDAARRRRNPHADLACRRRASWSGRRYFARMDIGLRCTCGVGRGHAQCAMCHGARACVCTCARGRSQPRKMNHEVSAWAMSLQRHRKMASLTVFRMLGVGFGPGVEVGQVGGPHSRVFRIVRKTGERAGF